MLSRFFQIQYQLGELFALIFGLLAVSIGVAAMVNAKLVLRYGMRRFIVYFDDSPYQYCRRLSW